LPARTPVHTLATPQELPDYHLPVLAEETDQWMSAAPGSFIIDGTLGGGGHSERFLNAGAEVLGIDRDPEALAHARRRLSRFGDRFTTWEGNFADLDQAPAIRDGRRADGILLDLGVSSHQLDTPSRGFSFRADGPLDMRMGPGTGLSAAEIVHTWDEQRIARTLAELGEEPRARRIAAAIVRRRAEKPFTGTLDLARCVESAVGGRQGRTHPATRTFQALRMAANAELDSLARALEQSARILKPGGLLLVITFHSLEDRMVKRFLRDHSAPLIDQVGWPEPRPNPHRFLEVLTRKAVKPGDAETAANPRARSAKLRVARTLPSPP
jgi:16S rRNA (cytosine1402-N4)-methyltransferase